MLEYMNNKMEEIFAETDIHYEKLREILGKNSEAIISEIYGDETILEPETFYQFISTPIWLFIFYHSLPQLHFHLISSKH